MRLSARADYALRATIELAGAANGTPLKVSQIAEAEGIPISYLEQVLTILRHARIVLSVRGAGGGFRLARDAGAITIADVIRAVEGPLSTVRGGPPELSTYDGAASELRTVWIAARHNLRCIVEGVTLADLAAKQLPKTIARLASDPDDWITRSGGTVSGVRSDRAGVRSEVVGARSHGSGGRSAAARDARVAVRR